MNYFGMVTTRPSHAYTAHALRSFFQTTPLRANDCFFLIDNDGTYTPTTDDARITLLRNSTPLGFAANVNQILRRARTDRADLFFLNNDLIFTAHWLEPLLIRLPVVLSPLSNGQHPCQLDGCHWGPVLDLPDYLGHEHAFRAFVRHRQTTVRGYQPVLSLPFFCVKIPYPIQASVGDLDEGFGAGGGEDWDYCLRCQLAGFPVQYALDSYVLHFMGKSTWRGEEAPDQSRAREEAYLRIFRAKWGPKLLSLVRDGRTNVIENPAVARAWQRGNFRRVIEQLSPPRAASTQACSASEG